MSQFQILPDEQALKELGRDLRFYPVSNDQPTVLTSPQVDQYNRLGYIAPLDVFSRAEIDAIRSYFDDLLVRVVAQGGDSYSISSAHLKYGPVYDILTDSRIVAYIADLFGENVIAWGSHFFCKMPHDGKSVAWHQDASTGRCPPRRRLRSGWRSMTRIVKTPA